MREEAGWFLLVAWLLVLVLADLGLRAMMGYPSTITAAVRALAARSLAPELVYLVAAYVLHGHLFRGWL